jgi:hypothetical protein
VSKSPATHFEPGQPCVVCGRPADHAHHYLRRSHGGADDEWNMLPLCHRCHIVLLHDRGEQWVKDRLKEIMAWLNSS